MKYFSKVFLTVFLFIVLSISVSAENFRVARLSVIDIPSDYSPVTVNVGINEGLCLNLPEDKTFIKGYEIEIKIPKIVATYRDSVIYSFYSDISPEPKDNLIDYSGTKVMNDTIPPRLSINLQTFLKSEAQSKGSPYSTLLPFTVSETQKNLTLRFQLAMKGVPESFLTSEFTVTVKPILKDVGLLSVNFLYPHTLIFEDLEDTEDFDDEIPSEKVIEAVQPGNISLYVDDLVITDFSEPILLKTGTHHISVVSDSYRNEVRTVIINQATNTSLDIESGFSSTALWLSAEPIDDTIPSPTRASTVSSPAPPTRRLMLARTVTRAMAMSWIPSFATAVTCGVSITLGFTDICTASNTSRPARSMAVAIWNVRSILAFEADTSA